MAEVRDLYEEPHDPQRPQVGCDETRTQLVAETRTPLPAAPGCLLRYDSAYRRHGVRNLCMFFAPQQGWHPGAVTRRRTRQDCAHQMRWLADHAYPQAEVIRGGMDNLNTHRPAALYETFAPAEARRILRRWEFHYTPQHGSGLNLAEMALGVFSRPCLDRRIPDATALERDIQTLAHARHQAQVRVNWQFTARDARSKLEHLYPSVSC